MPHFVRDFDFDISFRFEADAFEHFDRLSSFVSERLLSVADDVFTDLSPGDESIARIDNVEVDLGSIPASSYYEEAERRFRERLREAVSRRLLQMGGTAARERGTSAPAEEIVTRDWKELDIVVRFLKSGYLPWSAPALRAEALEAMVRRVLSTQREQLSASLGSAEVAPLVIRRIAWQFPADLLQTLADERDDRDSALLRTIRLEAGWLLRQRVFEHAVRTGDAGPLDEIWPALLDEEPALVEAVVRGLGAEEEVRRAMARGFPDPILSGIAGVLAPGEAGFIEDVTTRPSLFREAAQKQSESWPETRIRLWEFTFAYLLVERGGEFNRRSYLESVVRRMAAHYNLAYEDLLASLSEVLIRTEAPSAARSRMLELLSELRRQAPVSAQPDPVEEETWTGRLETAMRSGRAAPVREIWADVLVRKPGLLQTVVRRCGVEPAVRRAMCQGLPIPMLQDIAAILEPSEIRFIETMVWLPEAAEALSKGDSDSGERLLWEFSFTYLLTDRGSRFNRRAYAASMLRRMASARNLRYEDLFVALAGTIGAGPARGAHHAELLALLSELRRETFPDGESRERPGWLERLENALTTGDAGLIETEWTNRVRLHPEAIARVVRRLARNADLRRKMARTLPLSWLRDIARILEPSETDFIEDVIGQHETFREAALPGESREGAGRILWEFTVAYVVLDRGSVFNRRTYLESVIRRLAAHHNLRYDAVLLSIATVLEEERRKSGRAAAELSAIVGELRQGLGKGAQASSPATADIADYKLEAALPRLGRMTSAEISALVRSVDRLLRRPQDWFVLLLRNAMADASIVRNLSRILPDRQLTRILLLTAGAPAGRLLRLADLLVNASKPGSDAVKWQFLLRMAAERKPLPSDFEFVSRFVPWLAQQTGSRGALDLKRNAARRLRLETSQEGTAERRRLIEILESPDARPGAPLAAGGNVNMKRAPGARESEDGALHIFVRNAGQVLLGPFLPRLFAMTGLLEDNRFRDEDARHRAIHLLQYLVDASLQPPEHLLALNKLLCGLEPDAPVPRTIELTQSEKDAADGLLQAIIAHWTALGNTSVQGLRESFLQREGRLSPSNGNWHLLVQPRAFDMLLDRLPWSFKVTRHAWMDSALYVEWR
jgi:hypothetical protein